MAATSSPTSPQLLLALNCSSSYNHPLPISIRSRLRSQGYRFCPFRVGPNEIRVDRRRNGSSRIGSSSESLPEWSGSDDGDRSFQSENKKWPGGIVGAGVAGVVLVAGFSFVALSLSNRSVSRATQRMEPVTTEREVLLVNYNEDDKDEDNKSEENNVKIDDSSVESNTYVSSSLEFHEPFSENRVGENNETSSVDDVNCAMSSGDIINNTSVQDDLQNESIFDDESVVSEFKCSSQDLPNDEVTSEIEKKLVDSEPDNLLNITNFNSDYQTELPVSKEIEGSESSMDSSNYTVYEPNEPLDVSISITSQLDAVFEPQIIPKDDMDTVTKETFELSKSIQVSTDGNNSSFLEANDTSENGYFGKLSVPASDYSLANEQDKISDNETTFPFSFAGIPAPSAVSVAHLVLPGKVLVPAVIDQVQLQALAALQVLKVIESDIQPSDLCTRREYARWLVAASSALSRNTMSKVYPAMFIEDATELAFDDVTPDDPDFSFIQGLAEAGLISSKLSNHDLLSTPDECQGPFYFFPESPLSRQDLVSWKMALEKKQLPEPNKKILYQLSGFRDIDKINPDAWPALISDLSAGDQGIISPAFGCTRLFQPNKPVTKAQAAVALATGEASDVVSEELTRIEAESMAENAVAAHNALVAEVEKDMNVSFEKELSTEREKISAVEKMAEAARSELERLQAERDEDKLALMKKRAAIESEMEVLSRLRHEVEEQLHSLMSEKVEVSYEKKRIRKLQNEAENEKQEISRLQYELKVERKALSMARAWAEDEAKKAQKQAKALEEARDHWEKRGIKGVVDRDFHEESSAGVTWVTGKQFSIEETVNRGEHLVDKLKPMANEVRGKPREVIFKIVEKILFLISILKEWASKAGIRAKELKDAAIMKTSRSVQELQQNTTEISSVVKKKTCSSIQELQQSTAEFSVAAKEGAKRVAGECWEGVEKLTQRFKS